MLTNISDSSPSLIEIQQNILQNFYALHQFCESNNIRYYIIGGTLIGAVRHEGFIPWDDDIDIGIPRPDYDRLLELADKFCDQTNGRYKICHTGNDEGYFYQFAKSYDTQTTVTENFINEFTRGLWVDIFPLDATFTTPFLRKMHFNIIRRLIILCAIKSGGFPVPKNFIKRKFKWLIHKFIPVSSAMLNSLITMILKIKKIGNANYMGNFVGAWGYKEICRKHLFDESIKLKFETFKVNAPAGYDEYLKGIYGDYMTPPPPNKRYSHHAILRIDLSPYIHE
ncbi:MAG: LicD family protein [Azoarcus sp.]|jgi:lipopolysaccharide cholinephosphotransferase|nr:LicD family protein [Azoarcus sp.]